MTSLFECKKDAAYLILCPPNKIFLPSFLFPTKAGPLEYPRFPPQKPANMFSTLPFFLKFVTFVISVQLFENQSNKQIMQTTNQKKKEKPIRKHEKHNNKFYPFENYSSIGAHNHHSQILLKFNSNATDI